MDCKKCKYRANELLFADKELLKKYYPCAVNKKKFKKICKRLDKKSI